MLNFYLVSAGRGMVNDTDRSTTSQNKSKLHHNKETYKKWGSFRKHGFHLKTVWIFRTKNSKLSRLA